MLNLLKKYIYCILFCFSLTPFIYSFSPNRAQGPQELSPAELEKINKELEQMSKEIEQYVATLSPEEQAEFDRAVKEVETMMENMSPEEFESFINEMFQGPTPPEPEPTPVIPVVEEPKVILPTLSTAELQAQDNIILLLDSLIKHTNSFIVKAQSMPTLINNAARWAKQGKIKSWPADMNWSLFEVNLELFNIRLYALKDKDSANNQYRYLNELTKNKNLQKKLQDLEQFLRVQEPLLEAPLFGISKMSSRAKLQAQKIINMYSSFIFVDSIIKEIDTVIALYEPVAKQLQEQSQKLIERAIQASGRTYTPSRMVVGGYKEPEYAYAFGESMPFAGGSGSYQPEYTSTPSSPSARSNEEPLAKREAASSAAPSKSTGIKPSSKTESKKQEDKKETEEKESAKPISDPATDRLLGEIGEKFKAVETLLTETTSLKNLKEHIFSTGTVDAIMEEFNLNSLDKKINELESHIKAFERKIGGFAPAIQQKYIDEVNTIYNKYKQKLTSLKNDIIYFKENQENPEVIIPAQKRKLYLQTEAVSEAEGEKKEEKITASATQEQKDVEKKIEEYVATLSAEEQEAHKRATQKEEEQLKRDEPTGMSKSIFDILDSINKLEKTIKQLKVTKKVETPQPMQKK